MSDAAATDFREPRPHVRLDTILRLRWLAVLGQLATIFVVEQALDFELPLIPCLSVIAFSASVNIALQIAFNPMRRLQPKHAAGLLALMIAELDALLFLTGGMRQSVFDPGAGADADRGDRAAAAADAGARRIRRRQRHRTGDLASAAAVDRERSAGAADHLQCRGVALDHRRHRRHEPLRLPGDRAGAQAVGCTRRRPNWC